MNEAATKPQSLDQPTSPHRGERKHRHRHKSSGHRGKGVVLSMILLVCAYLGLTLYMSINGQSHPFFINWDYTTQLIVHGIFTPIILLCLFRLYRGSLSIKHLMGLAGILAAIAYGILIILNLLNETLTFWVALDSLGFLISAFVAWACLFSRGVSRFINYQQDYH